LVFSYVLNFAEIGWLNRGAKFIFLGWDFEYPPIEDHVPEAAGVALRGGVVPGRLWPASGKQPCQFC
jgi:hypothetical protein